MTAEGLSEKRWDSSSAVVFCDRCEAESGVGIADPGDPGCSVCGDETAPHFYIPVARVDELSAENERLLRAVRAAHAERAIAPGLECRCDFCHPTEETEGEGIDFNLEAPPSDLPGEQGGGEES